VRVPFVDLRRQNELLRPEIDAALKEVIKRGDFIMGEALEKFEKEFARHCGARHAVGTSSGLSALELGMRALGISDGQSVLTPANSFIASSSAVSSAGATPLLVDMDPETYNIDVEDAEKRIRKGTRAIMPVHLYGQPAEMDEVRSLAERHGLFIVEDACQAHGASYRGDRVGSLGDFAAFSFYPSKNLGAFGDGGAVVTNDDDLAEKVRAMRDYGQRGKHNHVLPAFNARLDTIQAAVLRVKLPHLDEWNRQRRQIAGVYDELLQGTGVWTPRCPPHCYHVYHQYVVQLEARDMIRSRLAERGIGTGLHYPVPIHLQPCFAHLGYGRGHFPKAEAAAQRVLSLPIFVGMTEEEAEHTAMVLAELVGAEGG